MIEAVFEVLTVVHVVAETVLEDEAEMVGAVDVAETAASAVGTAGAVDFVSFAYALVLVAIVAFVVGPVVEPVAEHVVERAVEGVVEPESVVAVDSIVTAVVRIERGVPNCGPWLVGCCCCCCFATPGSVVAYSVH